MLLEEALDFLLVDVAHLLGADGDLVAVLVAAFGGERVDGGEGGEVPVEDAEVVEVGGVYRALGVVGKALVALEGKVFSGGVCLRGRGGRDARVGVLTGRLSNQ